MSFSDFYDTDNGADSGTFTLASGGAASDVTILVDEDPQKEEGETLEYSAVIRVRQSEVVSRPVYRDEFAFTDGAGETITYALAEDATEERGFLDIGAEWVCKCIRNRRPVP